MSIWEIPSALPPLSIQSTIGKTHPNLTSRSVKSIQSQMEQHSSGFDPKKIFKSASSNVISSFCLNESYDFGDSEQMQILQWTESYFEKFRDLYLISGLAKIYPDFITRYGISRKILTFFKVSTFKLGLRSISGQERLI